MTVRVRRWPMRLLAAFLLLLVLGAMIGAEQYTQVRRHQSAQARFAARVSTSASFAQADVSYTLGRERQLAETQLASATVSQARFTAFLQNLDFGPALLLDSRGRVLDVTPYKASLIGTDIAPRYAHLSSAEAGRAAVSNVVPSAAKGTAVTGFATPFDTPFGRRVVSGAYNLAVEPMGIYLSHVVPWADGAVYLVDANGVVVTGSASSGGALTSTSPRLAAALRTSSSRFFTDTAGKASYFGSEPVAGTPWRLVLTIPKATLFSTGLLDQILPWVFLVAFGAVAAALSVLFIRGREERQRLAAVAHIDMLTGIPNRRSIAGTLNAMLSSATRHRTQLGLLMIDVDHFKVINDRFGHPVGDAVLRMVANRIRCCLRTEDVVGRWGGEEFVALVSMTTLDGAATAAERIRTCLASAPFVAGGHSLDVTVSIGVAVSGGETVDALVARADAALYLAKQTGRDRVVHAPLLITDVAVAGPSC